MTPDTGGGVAGASTELRPGTPDQTDRILVIAAVVLWLDRVGCR